ncbi:hypothetical protein [Dokdonella sp.]|uniref:hypothetical protein n=1 Tax=Dokdonella sp. TaxID=2291710 RepID=UPI00352855E5
MGRAIQTAAPTSTVSRRAGPDDEFGAASPAVDGYSDRLIKLIPAEVIGVYFSMVTLLRNSKDEVADLVPWMVFVFGALATLFYLRVTLKVLIVRQLTLSVIAFCVWAFTIGEPFSRFDWYNGTYAGLLLIAYTFVAPQIPMDGGQDRS